jgi:hypothetical protein
VVGRRKLIRLVASMPLDDERKRCILARIKADFAAAAPHSDPDLSNS